MIVTNGLDISGKDCFGRREDLSFIVRFNWKTSDHLKEAIQVLLAARLAATSLQTMPTDSGNANGRRKSESLDDLEYEQIRLQIASNPNTPSAVLAYLAKSATPKILERIAENPRTSVELLEMLAHSPIAGVRAAVGENVNTPHLVLEQLTCDSDADVRYGLAENPSTPAAFLIRLCEDSNPYVGARATATLSKISRGGRVLKANFGRCSKVEDQFSAR